MSEMRNLYSDDPAEVYANAFAMALLMPAEHVRAAHVLGLTTAEMADKFGVPLDVMAIRRHDVLAAGVAGMEQTQP